MKNKLFKFLMLAVFSVFYTLPALADPGTGGIGEEDEEPATPIDNWMLFLVLLGVAVGIYFILRNKSRVIA